MPECLSMRAVAMDGKWMESEWIDTAKGLLFRDADNREKVCMVETKVESKLLRAHDAGGHDGAEATLAMHFGPRERHNELRPTAPDFPFKVLFVGLIEDLPRTARGASSIMVFMDFFTKWTEACPVKDKSAASVKAALFQMIVSTRHPQSQGQVETTNKLIEERLRRSMQAGVDWGLYLSKAVYDINNRVVGSPKIFPSKALMGFVGRSAL
ncbi:hypothetical protein BGZ47_008907 [Haplosporangium gracile]|nr:hypothetical protein BGZ47_008907 [Haplosporangium gracile]